MPRFATLPVATDLDWRASGFEPARAFSEINGFLTAVAIGPRIPSHEWLAALMGVAALTPLNVDQVQLSEMLKGRHDDLLLEIEAGRPKPVFWCDADDRPIADNWAAGFFRAMRLRLDDWAPYVDSPDGRRAVGPILMPLEDDGDISRLGFSADEVLRARWLVPDMIPGCIGAIAAYWRTKDGRKALLGPESAEVSFGRRIGRNEPCPCGSGKKFKRCCDHPRS